MQVVVTKPGSSSGKYGLMAYGDLQALLADGTLAQAVGPVVPEPAVEAEGQAVPAPGRGTEPVQGTEAAAQGQPVQGQVGTVPAAEPARPSKAEDFEGMTEQETESALYGDGSLSEEERESFVRNRIASLEKELARLEKNPPKMGDDIEAYKRDRAAHEEKKARTRRKKEYWERVESLSRTRKNRKRLEEEAREAVPETEDSAEAMERIYEEQREEDGMFGEGRPDKKETVARTEPFVGRSLTEEEAGALIARMEAGAEAAPELELTPENWMAEFGEDGLVETPIGEVKMGENQLAKMFLKKRAKEFGMVKPTLTDPDVILEEAIQAKEGQTAERPSSYLFVKTFNRGGKKKKFYASVTVSKEGMEVVISNHYMEKEALEKKMEEDGIIYVKDSVLPIGSDRHLAENPQEGSPDLLPTRGNSESETKGSADSGEKQVPLDDSGNPVYEQAPVEATWEDLLARSKGDEAYAARMVESEIGNKESDLKKAERELERERKNPKGKSIGEMLRRKEAFESKAEEARRGLEYWRKVAAWAEEKRKAEEHARKMNERNKRSLEAKNNPSMPFSKRNAALGEANTFRELFLRMLATGEVQIKESALMELGMTKSDVRGLMTPPPLVSERHGKTLDNLVQDMWDMVTDGTVGPYMDAVDIDAVRSVIQESIGSVESRRDAMEQAERLHYMGMTEEEYRNQETGEGMEEAAGGPQETGEERLAAPSEPDAETKAWIEEMGLDYTGEPPFHRSGKEKTESPTAEEAALRDALSAKLREAGIEVVEDSEAGQRVLDEVNGRHENRKRKSTNDTALPEEESSFKGTVIPFVDTANIRKNLESLASNYERTDNTSNKNVISELGKAIGAEQKGSSSQYVTIEAKNGNEVTIRLSEHNASVERMDNAGKDNAISIVISRKGNKGIQGTGEARIVEYYYSDKKLRQAGGKVVAAIARSLQQTLYSGEYKDTTGLADVDVVNADRIREMRVYHGSGADFEAFDHSHMGEGEGAQAYGWGSYVTEVEGIGRTYAEASAGEGYVYKGGDSHKELAAEIITTAHLNGETPGQVINSLKEFAREDNDTERLSELEGIKESDFERPVRHLYTVEIPDDTGKNYLAWDKELSEEETRWIVEALSEVEDPDFNYDYFTDKLEQYQEQYNLTGEGLYKLLTRFGFNRNDRKASEALSRMGYTGISYPAQYLSGGRSDGARNYVIFKESDLKITDHVRFFRTPGGEAYGYTVDGKIYLDPRIATSETPVHEYAHLWAEALRKANPEEWRNIVGLMKDSPVWEEVKERYPELGTEDEIADEVLATYSGRRGAERLREARRKHPGKDFGEALGAIEAMNRVREALQRFWSAVADFLHINYRNAEEVADRLMRDLLEGVNPMKEASDTDLFKGVTPEARAEMEAIRSKAKADGTWMKAPNGNPTNLTERQWLQVRTKAFKKWFGDWERKTMKDYLLHGKPVSGLTGNEFQKDGVPLTEKVGKFYQDEYGGSVTRAGFGEVVLDKRGVKDSISHGIGRVKSAAFAAVPSIITDGRIISTDENWKGRNYDSYTFAAPVRIGTETYVGVVVVTRGKGKNENRFYLHEVVLQKSLQDRSIKTDTEADSHHGDIANVLKNIVSASDDVSKVVDGNGEPQVVYHGSPGKFYKFDTSKIGSSTGTADGRGFYFTTNKDYVRGFASAEGTLFEVFLNVRNPLSSDRKTITRAKLKQIIRKVDEAEYGREGEHYFLSNYGDYTRKGIENVISDAATSEYEYSDNDVELVNSLIGSSGDFDLIMDAVSDVTGKGSLIAPKKNGDIHYIVTSPSHIKSATDNNGRFSAEEDDIRFRSTGESGSSTGREAKERAARQLGVRLHVEVVFEDASKLSGRKRGAKGWFDPQAWGKDGRRVIHVALDNHADAADVERTILHEAVGHLGLREVLGPDLFDPFLDEVWGMMPEEIRETMLREAGKGRSGKGTRQLRRIAAEEWMAGMTEVGGDPTVWERIVSAVRGLLRKAGVRLRLSEWDIKALLYESRMNLERSRFEAEQELMESRQRLYRDAAELDREVREEEAGLEAEESGEAVNRRFNEELSDWEKGRMPTNDRFHLGYPQGVLRQFLPDLPIVMNQSVMRKGVSKKHDVGTSALRNMPEMIANPILVFKKNAHSTGILTEMKDRQGRNVFVAIEIDEKVKDGRNYIEVNEITSVHGRQSVNVVLPIVKNSTLQWVDKQKGLDWLSSVNPDDSQEIDNQTLSDATKVVENFENPKLGESDGLLYRRGDEGNLSLTRGQRRAMRRMTRDMRILTEDVDKKGWTREQNYRKAAVDFGRWMLDEDLPVKTFMDHLRRTGGKVDSGTDLYELKTTVPSKVKYRLDKYRRQIEEPLLRHAREMLKRTGRSAYELDLYLMAKHAPERDRWMWSRARARRIAEDLDSRLQDGMNIGTGLTDSELLEIAGRVANGEADLEGDLETAVREIESMVEEALRAKHGSALSRRAERAKERGLEAPVDRSKTLTGTQLSDLVSEAVERERGRMAKDTAEDMDFSGMTGFREKVGQTPEEYVEEFERSVSEAGMPEGIRDLWSLVNEATEFSLRARMESGLLLRKAYEAVKARGWKHYVPLRSWDEKNPESGDYLDIEYPSRAGSEGRVFENPKRAKGRKSLADSPLAYISRDAESTLALAEKNRYLQAVGRLAESNPRHTYIFGKRAVTGGVTGDGYDEKLSKTETGREESSRLVRYKVDGEERVVAFINPMLAAAVRGDLQEKWNKTWTGKVFKAVRAATRAMSSLNTALNPPFALMNLIRDLGFGFLSRTVEDGGWAGFRFLREWIRWLPVAFHASRDADWVYEGTTKDARYVREWKENGGETGWHTLHDLRGTRERLGKELRRGSLERNSLGAARAVGEGLRFFSEVSENSVRLAAFMDARRRGLDVQGAAYYAKEITTNFNRRSRLSNVFGPMYMFFNAQVQGVNRVWRLFRDHPKGFGGAALSMFVLGLLSSVAEALLSGEGDDDDYLERSPYIRYNNFVLGRWTIPLAHGFKMFFGLGASLGMYLMGQTDEEEMFAEMLHIVGGELLSGPLNATDLLEYDRRGDEVNRSNDYFVNLVPSILTPVAEVGFNRDYMGNPINREPYTRRMEDYVPDVSRYMPGTNPLLVRLTEKWASFAGYDPDLDKEFFFDPDRGGKLSEWFDVSASSLEHVLEGYFGGAGATLNDLVKLGGKIASGEPVDLSDIPVMNKLNRKVDPERAVLQDYYRVKEYVDAYVAEREKENKNLERPFLDDESQEEAMRRFVRLASGEEVLPVESFLVYRDVVEELMEAERQLQSGEISEEQVKALRLEAMRHSRETEQKLLESRDESRALRKERFETIRDKDLREWAEALEALEKAHARP